jgi:two-component system chemotaxis sensor kinase CheA
MPVSASVEICDENTITENDASLAIDFVAEALGHLDAGEVSLLHLEGDPGDIEAINSVFRAFHTIKGIAGFLGLKQIGALAHVAETLLGISG